MIRKVKAGPSTLRLTTSGPADVSVKWNNACTALRRILAPSCRGVNIGVVACGTPSRRNPCPTTDVVAEYGTETLLDVVDSAPREAAREALAAVLAPLVVEVDEVHDPVWLPLFCAIPRGEMETAIAIA